MHFPLFYWIKRHFFFYISWHLWVKRLGCAWGQWWGSRSEWLELEQGVLARPLCSRSLWAFPGDRHMGYFGLPQSLAASGLPGNFHGDLGSRKQGRSCIIFSNLITGVMQCRFFSFDCNRSVTNMPRFKGQRVQTPPFNGRIVKGHIAGLLL